MERKFNTKLEKIESIGNELRFQRDYYNFKNPNNKLIIRADTSKRSLFLGTVLQEFLTNNFEYMNFQKQTNRENYGEYGTGEDILYAIEHGKLKTPRQKRNEIYNPNAYYLRMYSLFKIYGFLDDYNIVMLLHKYQITPRFEKTKNELMKIKENCKREYENNPFKRFFNIKTCSI